MEYVPHHFPFPLSFSLGSRACYKSFGLYLLQLVKWVFTAWLEGTCSGACGDWRWSLTQFDHLNWHGGLKVCLRAAHLPEDTLSLLWGVLTRHSRGNRGCGPLFSRVYWVAGMTAQVEVITGRDIDASWEQVRRGGGGGGCILLANTDIFKSNYRYKMKWNEVNIDSCWIILYSMTSYSVHIK